MKGKKTDAATKAVIIETKINNPDLSSRDIEEIVGVDHSTITRVLDKDLQQVATESERIAQMIDSNNRLNALADEWIEKLTRAGEAKVSELVQVKRVTWEQNQVVQGNPTDKGEITFKWEA